MGESVMAAPKVSVILMVMNGGTLIEECIRSVLAQTMRNFEFIIIDDGSTDQTWDKINSYNDPRIRAVKQENRGIAASANRGLALASASYIARIDHDDLMMPTRLEKQSAYLDAHPDVALVNTYAQLIYGHRLSNDFYRAPVNSNALRLRLVFENPVVQPSVMMRTDIVRSLGGYNEGRQFLNLAEDFELWTRIARNNALVTIPEVLTHYRIRLDSASHSVKSVKLNVLISANFLHALLKDECSEDECRSLATIFHRMEGDIPALKLNRALMMFDRVANIISGPRAFWNAEVKSVYGLQRRMIFFHHILRRPVFRPFIQRVRDLRLRA